MGFPCSVYAVPLPCSRPWLSLRRPVSGGRWPRRPQRTPMSATPAAAPSPTTWGLLALDAPFVGTVTLPGGGTRDIKISPQFLTSTLLKTEVTASPTDSRYAIGHMVIRTNSLGRGLITFPTFAGPKGGTARTGHTTSQLCPVGTRVTKMNGKVYVAGVEGELDFTASRV